MQISFKLNIKHIFSLKSFLFFAMVYDIHKYDK